MKNVKKNTEKKKRGRPKKNQEIKRGRGRPSKIDDINIDLRQLELLAAGGFNDEEIAKFLNIAPSTLYLYKQKHPRFSEAINNGKLIWDKEIVEAFHMRAKGFHHPETKVFCNNGEIVTCEVEKYYPPDAWAAFRWLMNRRPADWREKIDITGKIDQKIEYDYSQLSTDELLQLKELLEKSKKDE